MTGFPPPPKRNRALSDASIGTTKDPRMDNGNEGVAEGANSGGKLTEDETQFILRTTLRPEHREDPTVLRFISSYMACRDIKQAAGEVGITPRSAQNLRNRPDIFDAITKLTAKSVMKYGFDASEVIEKVKEIAYIDPIEFVNEDGSYKTLHEMSPEARRSIKKFKAKNLFETDPNGMKVQVGVLVEIELWDKLKSVELLGRETELFKETKKVEMDVGKNMASLLLDSRRRAEERLTQSPAPLEIEARKLDDE